MSKLIKTGLVLEGGAMRGLFTAGVLDVFMENGVTFDGTIGVSAGAVFGCNIKSHQIGRVLRYNKKYCNDPRYSGFQSLLKTGDIYGVKFCYEDIPLRLDPFDTQTFKNSPMEFYVGCTDVETGRPIYHKCTDGGAGDIKWMQGSASMPVVSRIVEADGYKLLDGGVSESIPLRYFEHIGYNHNVIILTQPEGYVKPRNKMLPLVRRVLKDYPAAVHAMETRHLRYNRTLQYIREAEAAGRVLVIRPDEALNIGSTEHDPEKLQEVYDKGREVGLRRLQEVKDFLNNTARLDKQFAFIREIDKEKFIGRQTYLTDAKRKEDDAEHAWHMAIMTLLLSENSNENIDVLKTISMLLIHDLVEIDAGDTFAYDTEGLKTQAAREQAAADRIFAILPEDQGQYLRSLWEEFEAYETAEAKFAHTMDNLQPMMLNAATDGKAWVEHQVYLKNVLGRNSRTAEGSRVLWDYAYKNFLQPSIDSGRLKT